MEYALARLYGAVRIYPDESSESLMALHRYSLTGPSALRWGRVSMLALSRIGYDRYKRGN